MNRNGNGRKVSTVLVGILLIGGTLGIFVGAYEDWLQTSNDKESSGYVQGISMYPINEFPRPTGGGIPTYAYINNLDDSFNDEGNIFTHIASWYEGSQSESNIRVAFTTSSSDDIGCIYVTTYSGANIANFPIIYEDAGTHTAEGDIDSSIAVYKDYRLIEGEQYPHETLVVAACHDLETSPQHFQYENELHTYDLNGDMFWYCDLMDWESYHNSPIICEGPEWEDIDEDGCDDDFVYTFQYDATNRRSRIIAVDLTNTTPNGGEANPDYYSDWFEDDLRDFRPSYSTPVIRGFPSEEQGRTLDYYLFFILDEYEFSGALNDYVKIGSRALALDIDLRDLNGTGNYSCLFNIRLPEYGTLEIPNPPYDPEEHTLYQTCNMDPAAIWMDEFLDPGYADWAGFVFGTDWGSDGDGDDLIFVNITGDISETYNLASPIDPITGGSDVMSNPLVIGSPAVIDNPSGYIKEEIYVLYIDRVTSLIGVAYTHDVTEIESNVVFQYPLSLALHDTYYPQSPVITDEFFYIGCHYSGNPSPYEYNGGMVYINMETIRNNKTIGCFHTLPWSLNTIYTSQKWLASPAIIQVSSTEQYMFMGTSELNMYGGYLWRLEITI
jgi:hypothetical protein